MIQKSIIKAISLLTIFTIITRTIGFMFKIYLSNMLSPVELGIYTITISIYMLLLTFVTGNISTTISKNISQNKTNTTYKYKMVTNAIILALITSIIIAICVIVCKPIFYLILTDITYLLLLYLIPSIICMALYSPLMGYFWGENNYFYVSIIEFIEQIIRIVLSVILISLNILNNHMIAACLGLTIACAISTLIGFILYFKQKAKLVPTLNYSKEIISSTVPLT
ncbi:MAG: oligosaccharide flippase family protein, partial [Clostridia bacterium]|nr:oligosaccharide flippase family protein [Clostridia bacterium]